MRISRLCAYRVCPPIFYIKLLKLACTRYIGAKPLTALRMGCEPLFLITIKTSPLLIICITETYGGKALYTTHSILRAPHRLNTYSPETTKKARHLLHLSTALYEDNQEEIMGMAEDISDDGNENLLVTVPATHCLEKSENSERPPSRSQEI